MLGLCVIAGCAGRARTAPEPPRVDRLPTPSVHVGDCAAPERDGIVSEHPDRQRADRDLDGDGNPETVVADRALCVAEGNCYWNVFVRETADGCERFAGAVAGAVLEPAPPGTTRWPDIRGYWSLGGARVLIHTYQFRRGGYLLTEALLCRRQDDDRLLCAESDSLTR
jgi:hypothetical protein